MSRVAEPRRLDGHAARRAFAIGGVVGVLGGFLSLEIPPLGVLITIMAAGAPPRPATASGALVGASLGMAALLLVATLRCSAETSCSGPDLGGWIVAICACFAVGLALAAVASRRASKPNP